MRSEFENQAKARFFNFSSNETGVLRELLELEACDGPVHPNCNSSQFLALSAIANHPLRPAAGVAWSVYYTTRYLCTKKGHKARRREGDKCFSRCFFVPASDFSAMHQPAFYRRTVTFTLASQYTVYSYSVSVEGNGYGCGDFGEDSGDRDMEGFAQ